MQNEQGLHEINVWLQAEMAWTFCFCFEENSNSENHLRFKCPYPSLFVDLPPFRIENMDQEWQRKRLFMSHWRLTPFLQCLGMFGFRDKPKSLPPIKVTKFTDMPCQTPKKATRACLSMSTSSIEFSSRISAKKPSSDFSDRITPFSYTNSGYKTLIDKNTQTNPNLDMEKVKIVHR